MADREVYHILPQADWQAAEAAGSYRPSTLDAEGFVHCSTREQVVDTADRYFRGEDGLVLLCIDTLLLQPPLRYEAPVASGPSEPQRGLFPHVYGALNLDAVRRVLPFPANAGGSFSLPPQLEPPVRPKAVEHATQLTEETAQKLLRFIENTEPVRRLRASQLASGVLGMIGFALLIVGIENAAQDIPLVRDAYGSIAVGLLLLLATGLLLQKISRGE